ncbi:WD40/YVTN/BNR-like repeat-containing protein [Marinobacter halotolerans]|uniref:WD40/YVTN/BNR-like repeat-containing protein n=1 Tax=Marinobacter halotolerans TaxID=1569211 RepID=UPI001CD9AEBF|nr:YCF48-related protein [Marinobacter halotolerans]
MQNYSRFSVIFVLLLVALAARTSWGFTDPVDTASAFSPLAAKNLLNGVASAGDRLVAVGQRGHILYSDDDGDSWQQSQVPVSTDLTDVHFATPTHGWAVGHDGVVLKSVDAGESWVKQLDGRSFDQIFENFKAPEGLEDFESESLQMAADRFQSQGPENPLLTVWFEDEKNGFVFGVFNLILRTSDGGKSWTPWIAKTDNPEELHFYSAKRIGGQLYIVGERGLVLRLDTEKNQFVDVSVDYRGTLFGLTGDREVLLVFGLRGNLFRSHDGGVSWEAVETGMRSSITSGTVMPDGALVIANQEGELLLSEDRGVDFKKIRTETRLPVTDVVAVNEEKVVVVGVRGLAVQPLESSAQTDNGK